MGCRIGMTTDVEERKTYWQSQHPNLYNWQILGTYSSKTEAQRAETSFANQHGCVSHPGGDGSEYDTWYVYKFNY